MAMSWEGYSWWLLRACGAPHTQPIQLLSRVDGHFPADERELNSLQIHIRRMAHILENAHGNLAAALR